MVVLKSHRRTLILREIVSAILGCTLGGLGCGYVKPMGTVDPRVHAFYQVSPPVNPRPLGLRSRPEAADFPLRNTHARHENDRPEVASLAKTPQERSPNKDVPERIHVVEAGENLWRISLRYGTTVSELQRQNGLDNVTQLYVGQRLRITSGSTPASPAIAQRPAAQSVGPSHSASSHRLTWPVSGKVTSRYGTRWGNAHDGIDIGAPRGAPVYAAAAGEVLFSARHGGYGNIVVVKHNDGLVTVYAHHQINLVRKGQRVNSGQLIARVGQTGKATGPHLHFEVRRGTRPENPLKYLPPS